MSALKIVPMPSSSMKKPEPFESIFSGCPTIPDVCPLLRPVTKFQSEPFKVPSGQVPTGGNAPVKVPT